MARTGLCCVFVALVVLVALELSGCGGVAERSNEAEGAQASSPPGAGGTPSAGETGSAGAVSAGAVSASGQSSAGSGGVAQSCQGKPEACYQGCSAIVQAQDAVCRDGAWQCPDGSSFIADCPAYACTSAGFECCDPATGATSQAFCDASGTQWRCSPGVDVTSPDQQCVVKPPVCRVRSEQDLEGKACSPGDPQCNVGTGCSFCSCGCNVYLASPVWECNCVLC
jgi:hypothetical protein